MKTEDHKAVAELLEAGEQYLMLLGRLWRGDMQELPQAMRERLVEAVAEVVRRADR